jgi:hypothetical protein
MLPMSDRSELETAIRETGGTIEANGKIRGGNLSRVASKLGVARKTLFNHMRKLGLRGTSGRPKKSYRRAARRYAIGAAAVAVVGGAILLSKRGSST